MINLASSAPPLGFDTERFRIRRYVLADANNLCEAAVESVETVFPFLPWCHPAYSISESRDWINNIEPEWRAGRSFSFAIYEAQSKRFLGGCGLNRLDEHPVANLGYWVRRTQTGRGVATEATRGLARFAMQHLGFERVEIIMSTANVASRTVAERVGANHEGLLRSRLRLHGELHDAHMYSLTRERLLG